MRKGVCSAAAQHNDRTRLPRTARITSCDSTGRKCSLPRRWFRLSKVQYNVVMEDGALL